MGLALATTRPPRCVLVNVTSGASIACLFNPTQLSEKVQVHWNRLVVPGLSHQVLQFQSTGNRQLTGVEFYLDRIAAAMLPGAPDIMAFRAFLQALTVPTQDAASIDAAAPPRTLFIWPQVLTLETVVASVEFQYRQLDARGQVLVYAATVTFEEILDVRASQERPEEF